MIEKMYAGRKAGGEVGKRRISAERPEKVREKHIGRRPEKVEKWLFLPRQKMERRSRR